MPAPGVVRGNLNHAAASQSDRTGLPNTRTAAPQPQKAREGQPDGWATMVASFCNTGDAARGRKIFRATPNPPMALTTRSPRAELTTPSQGKMMLQPGSAWTART